MKNTVKWLRITWSVLLIGAALALLGIALATSDSPGIAVLGVMIVAFAAYWTYKGTTPEREPDES